MIDPTQPHPFKPYPKRQGIGKLALGRWFLKPRLATALLAGAFFTPAHGLPQDGERFQDWTVRCDAGQNSQINNPQTSSPQTNSAKDKQCYAVQAIMLKKSNKRLVTVVAGYPPGRSQLPTLIITLPLGVSLPPGGRIVIDDNPPLEFQVERCTAQGCLVLLHLEAGLLNTLRAGREALVTFPDSRRREISVPVSLLGFTRAFGSLR